MNTATTATRLEKGSVRQRTMDYLALIKPRIVVMVMAVTAVGFYMGTTGRLDWIRLLHLVIGVALAAGGTSSLNQYIERYEDALMQRTRLRPLPDGRIASGQALCFGVAITAIGVLYLTLMAHTLAGLVTALTVSTYLFWYTPMKRKTSMCLIVGAIPGALPPVTGWVAARGTFEGGVWVLFAILFFWQLPHALAIAWFYRDDYARAGFRMLPAIHPDGEKTARQIAMYSLALVVAGLLPTWVGLTGLIYFVSACVLGLVFLGFGVEVGRSRTPEAMRRLVHTSLIYLPLLFLLMVLDKMPY